MTIFYSLFTRLGGLLSIRGHTTVPFGSMGTKLVYSTLLHSKFLVEGGKLYSKTRWEGPWPDFTPGSATVANSPSLIPLQDYYGSSFKNVLIKLHVAY